MIGFLFGARRRPVDPRLASHFKRRDHWSRVHIAADRREPFVHLNPRKPNLVIGCICRGKSS